MIGFRPHFGLSREVRGASTPGEGLRIGGPLHGMAARVHALLGAIAAVVVLLYSGHLRHFLKGNEREGLAIAAGHEAHPAATLSG